MGFCLSLRGIYNVGRHDGYWLKYCGRNEICYAMGNELINFLQGTKPKGKVDVEAGTERTAGPTSNPSNPPSEAPELSSPSSVNSTTDDMSQLVQQVRKKE